MLGDKRNMLYARWLTLLGDDGWDAYKEGMLAIELKLNEHSRTTVEGKIKRVSIFMKEYDKLEKRLTEEYIK